MKLIKRLVIAALIGAALLSGAVEAIVGLDSLELSTLGLRFRMRPPPGQASPVTALLLRATRERQRERSLRTMLADTLEALAELPKAQHPEAVALDILLDSPDPSPSPIRKRKPAGQRVIEASARLPVVYALELALDSRDTRDRAPNLEPLAPHLPTRLPGVGFRPIYGFTLPPPDLARTLYASAGGVGHPNLLPPLGSSGLLVTEHPAVAYRLPMWTSADNIHFVPSLSLAGAMRARCTGKLADCLIAEDGRLKVGTDGPVVPLTDHGDMWLNLRQRFSIRALPGDWAHENRAPQILLTHYKEDGALHFVDASGAEVEAKMLAGQVVLIADQLEPVTVISPLGPGHPPWSLHAQAMANLLEEDFLRVPPARSSWAFALLGILLALGLRIRSLRDCALPSGPGGGPTRRLFASLHRSPELPLSLAWLLLGLGAMFLSVWLPMVVPLVAWTGCAWGWRFLELLRLRTLEHQHAQAIREREEHMLEAQQLTEELERELEAKREELEAVAHRALAEDIQNARAEEARKEEEKQAEVAETEAKQTESESEQALNAVARKLDLARKLIEQDVLTPLRRREEQLRAALQDTECPSAWTKKIKTLERHLKRLHRANEFLAPDGQGAERNQLLNHKAVQLGDVMKDLIKPIVELIAPVLDDQAQGDGAPTTGAKSSGWPASSESVLSEYFTNDPEMKRYLKNDLPKIARSDTPVLLLGPTGSGKEIIAEWIHKLSARSARSLVATNCAGVVETLFESEMFGHVKGAFSGATSDKKGKFRDAHRSTLFLDEIGALPKSQQVKLRRPLAGGKLTPVGQEKEVKVDVRIIAATSAPLQERVSKGEFDKDLFSRIDGHQIELPGLQGRPKLVLFLARKFLCAWCTQKRGDPFAIRFSDEAKVVLTAYEWPQNTRQLKQKVGAMCDLCDGDVIDAALVWSILRVKKVARANLEFFTAKELAQLDLMRQYGFDCKRVESESPYKGNRSTIDKHLRIFLAKALQECDWEVEDAIERLARTSDDLLRTRCRAEIRRRMNTFVFGTLARKVAELPANEKEAQVALGELRDKVYTEYCAKMDTIWAVVDALRTGKLEIPDSKDNETL